MNSRDACAICECNTYGIRPSLGRCRPATHQWGPYTLYEYNASQYFTSAVLDIHHLPHIRVAIWTVRIRPKHLDTRATTAGLEVANPGRQRKYGNWLISGRLLLSVLSWYSRGGDLNKGEFIAFDLFPKLIWLLNEWGLRSIEASTSTT